MGREKCGLCRCHPGRLRYHLFKDGGSGYGSGTIPEGAAGGRECSVLLAIFLGLLVGVGAFAIFLREATYGIWDRVATRVSGRALVFNVSQPTVVDRIQRLERVETVTYTMDKVVEGSGSSAILPDFLVGDKLLLSVHRQAIAGVDPASSSRRT